MNLNKVMLIGRLGRDPEIRYTKSGDAVANFSIATSENFKDRSGNKQERTEWHNIVAWARLADFAQNYLKKGKLIYVEGKMQTRDWTDTQNVKHYKTEVKADIINFMEPRGESDRQAQGGGDSYGPPPEQGQGQNQSQGQDQDPGPQAQDAAYVEDDIPF